MTPRLALLATTMILVAASCEGSPPAPAAPVARPDSALSDSAFAALHTRLSEEPGYFDTDNLISNETGYLNVIGALDRLGVQGGAYVGVGPDQNYAYLAQVRPEIAFMVDIRRDNALHHLLLKALVERAPTRVEFLAGLVGVAPPPNAAAWAGRSAADIVAWIDAAPADEAVRGALAAEVAEAVVGYGIPLDAADHATIRRFHRTFMEAGLSLRFTSFGRPPRPYYPTYRQLLLETDADGEPASYMVSSDRYRVVRDLHLANRIVPVVGDLAGDHALDELASVLRAWGIPVSAFYASNVEFYLWRAGTFDAWARNLAALPATQEAVLIRSYFPNFGAPHPSSLPGYYATQTLQPLAAFRAAVAEGGFTSYLDLVTRDAIPLR